LCTYWKGHKVTSKLSHFYLFRASHDFPLGSMHQTQHKRDLIRIGSSTTKIRAHMPIYRHSHTPQKGIFTHTHTHTHTHIHTRTHAHAHTQAISHTFARMLAVDHPWTARAHNRAVCFKPEKNDTTISEARDPGWCLYFSFWRERVTLHMQVRVSWARLSDHRSWSTLCGLFFSTCLQAGNCMHVRICRAQRALHLSGCTDEQLSGCTDEQLSGCTDEQLSGCTDEHLSGCTDEQLSGCTDEQLSGCTNEQLSGCTDEQLSGCTDEQLSGCTDEQFSGCTDEHLPGCTDEQFSGCTDEQLSGCTDEQLSGCTDEQLSGCTDEQLSGCTDEQLSGCTDELMCVSVQLA